MSTDNITAEERASLLSAVQERLTAIADEAKRFASAFRALEGEICDLAIMGEITRDLARGLINKPGLPREADLLFSAVQQLADQIEEFTTRYYDRWDGTQPSD
jgi:hypothetical protein